MIKMVYVGDNPVKDFLAPQQLVRKSIFFKNTDGLYSHIESNQTKITTIADLP
jgi:hypothetical protein